MARTKADSKTRLKLSAAVNIALIIMELYALISSYIRTQSGFFSYYTQDSNIFALIEVQIHRSFHVMDDLPSSFAERFRIRNFDSGESAKAVIHVYGYN